MGYVADLTIMFLSITLFYVGTDVRCLNIETAAKLCAILALRSLVYSDNVSCDRHNLAGVERRLIKIQMSMETQVRMDQIVTQYGLNRLTIVKVVSLQTKQRMLSISFTTSHKRNKTGMISE